MATHPDLDSLFNGANAVWLGGEIIQFTYAEVIDATHFKITGLRRGRHGLVRIPRSVLPLIPPLPLA